MQQIFSIEVIACDKSLTCASSGAYSCQFPAPRSMEWSGPAEGRSAALVETMELKKRRVLGLDSRLIE